MANTTGKKFGGRQKGTPNKATADIKKLARDHTAAAMKELVRIASSSDQDSVRVSAIKEIFDRAYGKAPQALTGADGESDAVFKVIWMQEGEE